MFASLFPMESAILLGLQSLRTPVVTALLSVYTQLGNYGILWIVLSVILVLIPKKRLFGLGSGIALVCSLIFTNGILKHLFARIRPWLLIENLVPLVVEKDPLSFPSGHSSAAFAACICWCILSKKKSVKVITIVLAAIMAFSRLYVGVHFPTDVIAGVMVGIVCGVIGALIIKAIQLKIGNKGIKKG